MINRQISIRPAVSADATQCSQVFCDSIRELCRADHNGDEELIRGWSINKTPEHILDWIKSGSPQLFVAQWLDHSSAKTNAGNDIVAVGGITLPAEVSLNYVAPSGVGYGVGRAMLSRLENELKEQGALVATLTSTKSAFEFYKHLGWSVAGELQSCMTVEGYPMQKKL